MMNCKKAERLLSRYIDGELDFISNSEVMAHVSECKSCSAKLEKLKAAVDALNSLPMDDPGDEFNAPIINAKKDADAKKYAFAKPICRWGIIVSIILALVVIAVPIYVSNMDSFIGNQEIYLIGPDKLIPGSRASMRVVVAKRGAHHPIENAQVTLSLNGSGLHSLQLMSCKTDKAGTLNSGFRIPNNIIGNYRIVATASSSEGKDTIVMPVEIKRNAKVMVSTDKPIYQPGQIIHLRALALQRPSLVPANAKKIKFVIEDPKKNRVFNKTFTSSKWGIASADFELGSEINLGKYTITTVMDGTKTKKVVSVKRYVLPKFKIALDTDQSYYAPGKIIHGTLSARYFFGKPVAGAQVRVELASPRNRFAEIIGRTNSDGVLSFDAKVPNQLVSYGDSSIKISASVIDDTQHTEEEVQSVPVAKDPLRIAVVPESGQLVPGVENIVYVVTSFPDGTPTRTNTSMVIDGKVQTRSSDALGVSAFKIVPGKEKVTLGINAAIPGGVSSSRDFTYDTSDNSSEDIDNYYQWAVERKSISDVKALGSILVRANKAIYQADDKASITILCTKKSGPVYIDAILDGQTISTVTAQLKNGKAQASFNLSNDYSGTLTFSAYMLSAIGTPVRDTSTVFVQSSRELKIAIKPGKSIYKPGEHARLEFSVSDNHGKGMPAAIGVNIVDESVYSVEEQMPGLAALYFAVQKDLLKPKYEKSFDEEGIYHSWREHRNDPDHYAREIENRLLSRKPEISGTLPGWNDPDNLLSQTKDASIQQAAKVLFASAMNIPDPAESSITQKVKAEAADEAKQSFIGDGGFGSFLIGSYLIVISLMAWTAYRNRRPYILIAAMLPLINFAVLMVTGLIGLQVGYDHTAINETLSSVSAILLVPLTIIAFIAIGRISSAWINFAICLGIFLLLAAILFPVFAKARRAASGSVISEQIRMLRNVTQSSIIQKNTSANRTAIMPRIRQFFPETMYSNPAVITDESGKGTIDFYVADSITTWRVSATASSMNGHIGSVSAPMKVFQNFFIDLDLPQGITQGDSISVPVAVYNYLSTPQNITLKFKADRLISAKSESEKSINLKANEVSVVYFPIKASKLGRHSIVVEAISGSASDAVSRELMVYPNGLRQNGVVNGVVSNDTSARLTIPRSSIPGASRLLIKFYPGIVSQIAGGLAGLLQEPTGCFEQTSSIAYPNVLVMKYLKSTDNASSKIISEAEHLVNLGYQRLVVYEVPGGGFDWYGEPPADTILTAYGLMEFADMADVTQVDRSMIHRAKALLDRRQNSDGSWGTKTICYTLNVADSKICATAYVTWALAEAGYAKSDSVKRGCAYLGSNLNKLRDPYVRALAANAFVASGYNNQITEKLLDQLANSAVINKNRASWRSKSETLTYSNGCIAETETTALAAYAFFKSQTHINLAKQALNELIAIRNHNGSWDTTQTTILALKALLASRDESNNKAGDIDVIVNGQIAQTIHINNGETNTIRIIDATRFAQPGVNTVMMRKHGNCRPMYQITSEYYIPWSKSAKQDKNGMHLDVSYAKLRVPRNKTVDVTAKLSSTKNEVKMGIIDMSIAPGFGVETGDLEILKSKRAIDRYEINPRQLILYVRNVGPKHPIKLHYRLRAQCPVRAQVPASRAYDYYNPNTCSSLSLPVNVEVW